MSNFQSSVGPAAGPGRSPTLIARALREFAPGYAWGSPAFFLGEAVGALLIMLAARDMMLGRGAAFSETIAALAIWSALLLASVAKAASVRSPRQTSRQMRPF